MSTPVIFENNFLLVEYATESSADSAPFSLRQ